MSHAVTIVGTPLGIVARDSMANSPPQRAPVCTTVQPHDPTHAPSRICREVGSLEAEGVRGVSWRAEASTCLLSDTVNCERKTTLLWAAACEQRGQLHPILF